MNDKYSTWEDAVVWLRSQPDKAELTRACYFDDPLSDAADRFYHSSEWVEIRKRLKTGCGGTVLDLGAGRGISSYAFARDGWKVVAIEPDPSRIVGAGAIKSLADDSNLPISVVRSFAESVPFKNHSFDVVYGRQVLHHAQDLPKMCKEISRVLKPTGIFIATREHVIDKPEDLTIFLARHPLQQKYGGENAYLLKQYLRAIRDSGIQITETLNSWNSDINLFPESIDSIKQKIAKKTSLPYPSLIPDGLLRLWGVLDRTPGRMYSFFGRKNHEK